jgi:hypothetical protein
LKADISGAPALSLATTAPRVGQVTYAIGYPRKAYLDEDVPLDQTIRATMTSGSIVNSTQRPGGWTALGTDAEFTHGDSGGPVVDSDGNVIGVISFIFADEQGNQIPGRGYFVPVEYVAADLAGDSVRAAADPRSLTRTYYHALAEGDIKRYRTELGLLQDVQTRSPFHAYVKDDIANTQTQILSGHDNTPPDLDPWVMASPILASGVIGLAIAAWIGMALFGRAPRSVVEVAAEPPVAAAIPSVADIVRDSAPIATNGVPQTPAPPPSEPAETQRPQDG